MRSLAFVKANLEDKNCVENEYRSCLVEMLGRIPLSDIPKQNIRDLIKACQSILFEDHEDNGAIAQKVLADVHKTYKTGLEEFTSPYFDWLCQLFQNFPDYVARHLEKNPEGNEITGALVPAIQSMKLAQEIALTAFALMQSYSKRLSQYGERLVRAMVDAISLEGPDLENVPKSAMQMYTDFRFAQIKTLIFVIVLSRSNSAHQLVVVHKDGICSALVRIMKTSPSSLALRKEILNGFRTILSSDDVKDGLVPRIDDLLNMDTLVGNDRAVHESLKQIAFIHLTELLLLVKQNLEVVYVKRAVAMAVDSLLDVSAPLTLHVTSVRVLYNIVVEIVFPRRAENENFRDILSDVLSCISIKLESLAVQVPRILSISRDLESLHRQKKSTDAAAAEVMAAEGRKELIKQKEHIEGILKSTVNGVKMEEDTEEKPMDTDQKQSVKVEGNQENAEREVALSPFKTVYQATTHASNKERELLEFRNLAHGLINTVKTVSYVIVVYHTSRGLKGQV